MKSKESNPNLSTLHKCPSLKRNHSNQLVAYYPPNLSTLKKSVHENSESTSNKDLPTVKKFNLSYIHEEVNDIQVEEILLTETDDQVLFRASEIESSNLRYLSDEEHISMFDNKTQ